MSDTGNRDDRGTPDVAESEAAAVAEKTSAEQIKPDTELVAPTTSEDAADGSSEDAADGSSEESEGPDAGKDRRMSQGSGHASPSMGEQQTEVRPQ